ncbi:hypothetical protein QUA86_06860 [Microcoleus sp. F6_B6]
MSSNKAITLRFSHHGLAEKQLKNPPQRRPSNDKKPKITDWLEAHRPEIIFSGKLVGFVEDKYSPLLGD